MVDRTHLLGTSTVTILTHIPLLLLSSVTALLVPLAPARAAPAAPLEVVRITPTDEEAASARQIVVQFSEPMVPLGKMERTKDEVPVTVDPAPECEWRWLNTTTLSCNLGEKKELKRATKYRVAVRAGTKSFGGAVLAKEFSAEFTTELPKIRSYEFRTWKSPVSPQIVVVTDQPVTEESVAKTVSFVLESGKPVTAQISPALPEEHDGDEEYEGSDGDEEEDSEEDDEGSESAAAVTPPEPTPTPYVHDLKRWLVVPSKDLPSGQRVQLKIAPGLAPKDGGIAGTESRAIVSFATFGELAFKGITCYPADNDEDGEMSYEPFDVDVGTPLAKQPPCDPLRAVSLRFTAPVGKARVSDVLAVTPDLAGGRTDYKPWDNVYSWVSLNTSHADPDEEYRLNLPFGLKAHETYTLKAAAGAVTDEFDRKLPALDMQFKTDHRRPKLHLENKFSALEKQVDTHLPVVAQNLKKLTVGYDAYAAGAEKKASSATLPLYTVQDVAYPFPIEVRSYLDGKSGVIFGDITPDPIISKSNPKTSFFSQVTPFGTHVKLGYHNIVVWVTDLATGEPVRGAKVTVESNTFSRSGYLARGSSLGTGTTDDTGAAILPGLSVVDPKLELAEQYDNNKPRLAIRVEKDEDQSLVPISYDTKVYTSGVYGYNKRRYGHVRVWGTTAQGIYRAGDRVQFTLYARDESNRHLVAPPPGTYSLKVIDPMEKVVLEEKDFTLSEFGGHHGELALAPNAAVGWYRFQLSADFTTDTWEALRVLVSDFTPAPFKVAVELATPLAKEGDEIKVTTEARLHAGGPYASADNRVTAWIEPAIPGSDDPKATGFWFASSYRGIGENVELNQTEAKLDAKGDNVTTFTLTPNAAVFGSLVVESAVRDDRGKYVAGRASVKYRARDRYVGLKSDDWLITAGKPFKVDTVVINSEGGLEPSTPVTVTVEFKNVKAARVKGPGNAYITDYTTTWDEVHTCNLTSALDPVPCDATVSAPGVYRIKAEVADTKGRKHAARIEQYAVGSGEVLWETAPTTDLSVIPEKKSYKVGETARFMLKNPFPGAYGLFTIERLGVQKHWIQKLADSTPVIEVPVGPDQVPGFYFSALVFSPRVDKPLDEKQVDLGKPAFRLGYAQIDVSEPYKALNVTVKPSAEKFKPRETVTVNLSATAREGAAPPIEYAVTVLDESVFDLLSAGKSYFDPYRGFYSLGDLDVENFNLLRLLVGRQKFEKKGATHGGDGGGNDLDMRSLFKFVSYWNPALEADGEGRASFSFDLPDNLTGWKVFAMAVSKDDRFGLGEGKFVVNKLTEIRPALPNQVLEGDEFTAAFTVMNRGDAARTLEVKLEAIGEGDAAPVTKSVQAAPFERQLVNLPVIATRDGTIKFRVSARDAADGDQIELPLTVKRKAALEAAATYGTSTESKLSESLKFPDDMRTDIGRVSVVLSPSVVSDLEGAFKYMKEYPYACWEQKLSTAVMAGLFMPLRPYVPKSFEWPDAEELPGRTLALMSGYQAQSGGMTYYQPKDEFVDPYLSAFTALALNWLEGLGHEIPEEPREKLDAYLKGLLGTTTFPDYYSEGNRDTTRAVALLALAERKAIDKNEVERFQAQWPRLDLFSRSIYLRALLASGASTAIIDKDLNQLLSASNETGGKLSFSGKTPDDWSRILGSTLRTNCSILSTLVKLRQEKAYSKKISEDLLPKLVRFVSQSRKGATHWENTQENLYCMEALSTYRAAYEAETPDMSLKAEIVPAGGTARELGTTKFEKLAVEPREFDAPLSEFTPGEDAALNLVREGVGRYYYAFRLFYAPKTLKREAINAGMEVRREYSVKRDGKWALLESPMKVRQGELVKVDIFASLPGERTFVVIDDAVPGGLEPVNRELATASTVDDGGTVTSSAAGSFWFTASDWVEFAASRWTFYHRELRHDSARFYSEYLEKGNYHVAYVAQAIAKGTFTVLPTKAEEMYDPDVFGQSVPAELIVE